MIGVAGTGNRRSSTPISCFEWVDREGVRFVHAAGAALQGDVAQIGRFVAEQFFGDRVDQRLAGTKYLEQADAVQLAAHICLVVFAQIDAAFLRGDDARRAFQLVFFHDQRLRQERLDVGRRNRGNGVGIQLLAADLRRAAAVAAGTGDRLAQAQTAGGAIEVDDLAWINPVRVVDLRPVHVPDLRPAPRMLQEFAGNVPQRIAAYHHVLIRRRARKLQRDAVAGAAVAGAASVPMRMARAERQAAVLKFFMVLPVKAADREAVPAYRKWLV